MERLFYLPPSARLLPLILLLGGTAALGFALIAQYGFGLPPCHFCLLQRYPYGVAMLAGIAVWILRDHRSFWQSAAIIGLLAFMTTAALGAYHTGIERGWIEYQGGCVADAGAGGTLDTLRQQIIGAPRVSCSDAAASFLGLSMASWNTIYALVLAAFGGHHYRIARRNHG